MKKRDMIFITLLFIASICGFIFQRQEGAAGDAYIYHDGVLYGSFPLSVDRDIRIESANGTVNEIRIEDNSIFMKSSTCPGRVCVNTGHISNNNESICCAPAKLLIVVKGGGDGEYDAITQ